MFQCLAQQTVDNRLDMDILRQSTVRALLLAYAPELQAETGADLLQGMPVLLNSSIKGLKL